MPYLSHNYRCKPKPRLKSLTEAGTFLGLSIFAIMLTLSILGYVFAWAAQI